MSQDNPLRRARLERGFTLEELAARAFLTVPLTRKIDEGRFDELPAGLYARAYVRAYAKAVGLDPAAIVAGLAASLPVAEDPFPVMRDVTEPPERAQSSLVRWVAAAMDAALLIAINAVVVTLAAWMCGAGVGVLLQRAGGATSVVCAFLCVLYFLVFRGIGDATPGAWLCRRSAGVPLRPLRLERILRRAIADA
ncbi:MAG TPA: helix-turn-helix domain-containing protein [Vicinamibacterales bacterium]|nr:helix-turn-helix domain-containing protein [Vicinamibacterales bacterium]